MSAKGLKEQYDEISAEIRGLQAQVDALEDIRTGIASQMSGEFGDTKRADMIRQLDEEIAKAKHVRIEQSDHQMFGGGN